MIRGFCPESRLQPERCSSCGSANSESDDARFEHGSLRLRHTVGADLDFAACRIGLAPRPDRWCVAPPDRFTSDAFNLMEACAALTPPDDGLSAYNS